MIDRKLTGSLLEIRSWIRTIKDMRQKSTAQDFPHEAFDHEDDTLEGQDLQGTAAFDAGVGDMPSWGDIVAQHADSVYRLAYRLSGNQHDAEDLTQETFMRVFRSIKNYQPGTFEGWLHRITTNLFLDMVRHVRKFPWNPSRRIMNGCPAPT